MKKTLYFIIIILVFSLNKTNSQTVNSPSDRKVPTMNGHTFPSSSLFGSSFITTSLHAKLGFGLTSSVKIIGFDLEDYEIPSFEGRILYFSTTVKYQQRFTPWLALFMSFNMAGRVGTDISTIVADGVNTLGGGDIGWLIRIRRTEKFNFSGVIKVQNLTGNFINLSDYVRDIINNVPDPSFTKKVPALIVGIGARGAYAFNPTFGLQFIAEFDYGESFDRAKTKAYFSAGVMGDIDFMPKHNTPIGLGLGYSTSTAPEIVMSEGGFSHLFSGKIGYTGSDEFELALQYSYFNVTIQSAENKPFISKIALLLKFYF